MTAAAELLHEVEGAGGQLILLDNGGLRVKAPKPLPGDLVDRLRQHKPAIIDYLTPPAPEKPMGMRSPIEPSGWDGEMAELVRWFCGTRAPQKPFALTRGVTIIRPALWWTVMRRELALGPHGTPRARTGALREDLLKLVALMRNR